MTRLEINREILKLISDLIESSSDLRFIQMLQYLDCTHAGSFPHKTDQFYEESEQTLERIKIILQKT